MVQKFSNLWCIYCTASYAGYAQGNEMQAWKLFQCVRPWTACNVRKGTFPHVDDKQAHSLTLSKCTLSNGGYSTKQISVLSILSCKLVVRLLNKCYWTRSFEQNRWTKNQLNKNLLNKKSIEQVDNWTNIWLNNYHLNKCIWTKLLQQLNKSWIEQVVTILTWLCKLRLAECVVARQRHEARGVWGACPPF